MERDFYTARVPAGVADLIPAFLENRHKEVAELRALLAAEDFERIVELSERMIGVGTPFGFEHVTNLARIIRECAWANDTVTLAHLIADLANYLRIVKIVVR